MNFVDIKIKIILSGFFIVHFFGILQFVEADLPNRDRRDAIRCMRKTFGEDFITKSFTENDDAKFFDGEYLGEICDHLSDKQFKEIIKNEGTYDFDGEELKTCLRNDNREMLFENYRKLGVTNESKNHLGTVAEAEKQEYQSRVSEMNVGAISENSDLLSSVIYYFVKGICSSEREEVEFVEVTGEEEKKETISCLVQCTGKFMQRIQNRLMWETGRFDSLLNRKMNALKNLAPSSPNSNNPDKQQITKKEDHEEEQDSQSSSPNSNNPDEQQITEEKHHEKELDEQIASVKANRPEINEINDPAKDFIEIYERSKQSKNIEWVENVGNRYLDTYSTLYHNLNYFKKKSNTDVFKTLDNNLLAIFSLYKNCSKLGCGMTQNSTPLLNLIEKGAAYQIPKVDVASNQPVLMTVEEKRRNFFNVLIGKRNEISQNEDTD